MKITLRSFTILILCIVLSSSFTTTVYASNGTWSFVRQDTYSNVYGLHDSGCGIFALINAVGYLTGRDMGVENVAAWASQGNGYSSSEGTVGSKLYKRAILEYGDEYCFTGDGAEIWAGWDSQQLKNHLTGGGVAVGHVEGHFIAIIDYNSTTNKFHVLDSYPTNARGTKDAEGDVWRKGTEFTSKMILDRFYLLTPTSYLSKCTPYPTNLTVKTTQGTYLKSLPCRKTTDPNSTDVVNGALPVGTPFTVTEMYRNERDNYDSCWYKVTYQGNEGYIFSGHTKVTSYNTATVTASGGNPYPTTIEYGRGYWVTQRLDSNLRIDTVQGFIYDSQGKELSEYCSQSKKTGINNTYYQLGSEGRDEPVDGGLPFPSLPAGNYSCEIKAKCKYYYGDSNGNLQTKISDWVTPSPISFSFIKEGNGASYLNNCTPYPTNLKIKITNSNAFMNTLPCSIHTDPSCAHVIDSKLPNGTTLTTTKLYVNDQGNVWYEATIDSGTYAGKKGYVYASDTTITSYNANTVTASGGNPYPTSIPQDRGYWATWLLSSSQLRIDTVQGYFYDNNGNVLSGYPSEKNGINAMTYQLGSDGREEPVDGGLLFLDLPAGNYTCKIKVKCQYYYGDSNANLQVKDAEWATPVSFSFTKEGQTYLDRCNVYPTYLKLTTTDGTSVMSLPCSNGTDPNSVQVRYLDKGAIFTATELYVNPQYDICWYKGTVDSTGESGYLVSTKCQVSQYLSNEISTSGGNDIPTTIAKDRGYWVTWLLSSNHLNIDTVQGYFYDSNGTILSGYPSEKMGVNSKSYQLGSEGREEPVDGGLRFLEIPAGNYICSIKVKSLYYYGSSDGSLKTKADWTTPISFSFTKEGDASTEMIAGGGRTIPDGNYIIANAANTSFYLDIDGTAYPAANNTNVILWGPRGEPIDAGDTWSVSYNNDGFYTICQNGTNMALDVSDWSSSDGANIQVYPSSQKWSISQNSNGSYRIQAKHSGLSVDIKDGNISAGRNIQQWSGNDTAAQQWVFIPFGQSEITQTNKIVFHTQGGTLGEPCASRVLDGINTGRLTGQLIAYNNPSSRYECNCYGREIAVDSTGEVVAIREYGDEAQLAIPNNGFVLSGHLAWPEDPNDGYNFLANISIGQYVGLDYDSNQAYVFDSASAYLGNCKYVITGSQYGVLPEPIRDNYLFDGWYTAAEGGTKIESTSDYSTNELFAHWSASTCTITYNANGGTGAPASQTKSRGIDITLSSQIPSRSGWYFLGWATDSNAASSEYLAGDRFSADADTTLYAVWRTRSYEIAYDANDGTGAPEAQTKIHGTALTLSNTIPSRDGYNFLGWAISADATSAEYHAGDSFTTEADTTLYAVWKIKTYAVTYNVNGGEDALEAQIKMHGIALVLTSTMPIHTSDDAGSYTVTLNANGGSVSTNSLTAERTTSYSFKNWNTAANGSGTSYNPGGSYTANAAVTLYAQWNSNTTTAAVTLPTPTRNGYSFLGWGTSSSATSGVTGSYTPAENVTLYAVWDANSYPVSYDANGGTNAPNSQTKIHDTALTLATTTPTHANASAGSYTVTLDANGGSVNTSSLSAACTRIYSFKNWNTSANGSGTSYAPGASYTANAALTLYAQWNSSISTVAVTLPTPTREGYSFKGWGTSENATEVLTGNYTPTENIYLFAIWEINKYTVKFVNDDGTVLQSGEVAYGVIPTFTGQTPTKAATAQYTYTFKGWDKDIVSVTSAVTYTATYTAIPVFGSPTFTLPAAIKFIEESAFEGLPMTIVEIPYGCKSIGKSAFKDCTNLTQIRIPDSITAIDDTAFDGCTNLFIFGAANSAAKTFCDTHTNCIFVAEDIIE